MNVHMGLILSARHRLSTYAGALLLLAASILLQSCGNQNQEGSSFFTEDKKIGVLLVNHGSHSETWRNTLIALEHQVTDSILATGEIQGIKTAFMEYTEPSIATRLREFDAEGYTDIVIVPVFLTVSTHSFDDIPTIIGKKEDPQSMETLKLEKIARYTPNARTYITPLLDFTDILRKNVLRRFQQLSKDPSSEGLVMIAYGDATYLQEWTNLLQDVGDYVTEQTGITSFSSGWCGHLVRYSADSTTEAIRRVLKEKPTAVVIPVLVAVDEDFQVKIIGDGIAAVKAEEGKVLYKSDAILPDRNIEHWVIEAVSESIKSMRYAAEFPL